MKTKKSTRYILGRNYEYKFKELLESKGNYVVRSSGSKGHIDLVALPLGVEHTLVKLCQVKSHRGNLTKSVAREIIKQANGLLALDAKYAIKILAVYVIESTNSNLLIFSEVNNKWKLVSDRILEF